MGLRSGVASSRVGVASYLQSVLTGPGAPRETATLPARDKVAVCDRAGAGAAYSAAMGNGSIGLGKGCTVAPCGSGSSAALGRTSQWKARAIQIETSSMIV